MKMTKKRRRGKRSFTIPMATVAGVIGSPAVHRSIDKALKGDYNGAMIEFRTMAGIWSDGSFHIETVVANVLPILAGAAISKFIGGTMGVNRKLAAAGVPIIRV